MCAPRRAPPTRPVLDTNLLLYAANADAPEHPSAVEFLSQVAGSADAWYLTEGICYEFLRVSTHSAVFPRPLTAAQALSFLTVFFGRENFRLLGPTERHWEVLVRVLGELHHPSGNLFFDIRTATLMREHGVKKIYSLDKDFLQFSGIQVIDPLGGSGAPFSVES